MQGITSLYRTGVPATDPTFLPSCVSRDDYQNQTGQQAPNNDPSQPFKYWWDPKAAALPPSQMVTYLFWNGSVTQPALVSVSMTAATAASVNLPGDQTYPVYSLPPQTAMWVVSPQNFPTPQPFNSDWLSKQSDAQALVAMFPGATLQTGQQCYPNAKFILDSTYPDWQPWVMVLPNGVKTFCGGMLYSMFGHNEVNGGGRGNPGKWVANADGTAYAWTPTPVPSGQSSSTMPVACNQVPSGFYLASVMQGIFPTVEILPIGSDGQITIVVSGTLSPGTYALTPVTTSSVKK